MRRVRFACPSLLLPAAPSGPAADNAPAHPKYYAQGRPSVFAKMSSAK